jgi:hypothetical protein
MATRLGQLFEARLRMLENQLAGWASAQEPFVNLSSVAKLQLYQVCRFLLSEHIGRQLQGINFLVSTARESTTAAFTGDSAAIRPSRSSQLRCGNSRTSFSSNSRTRSRIRNGWNSNSVPV